MKGDLLAIKQRELRDAATHKYPEWASQQDAPASGGNPVTAKRVLLKIT